MLAAIGVIIMVKQIPVALGVQGRGEPLEMIKEIPNYVREMNPEIALIGLIGVLIMFTWPLSAKVVRRPQSRPRRDDRAAGHVPMGMYFRPVAHAYVHVSRTIPIEVGESFLVNMPDRVFGMFDYIARPDFSAFSGPHLGEALKWVFMFFVIGSLESLLSAKAVDIIDPWKRKTNLDRDMVAVGAGNLCSCAGRRIADDLGNRA